MDKIAKTARQLGGDILFASRDPLVVIGLLSIGSVAIAALLSVVGR